MGNRLQNVTNEMIADTYIMITVGTDIDVGYQPSTKIQPGPNCKHYEDEAILMITGNGCLSSQTDGHICQLALLQQRQKSQKGTGNPTCMCTWLQIQIEFYWILADAVLAENPSLAVPMPGLPSHVCVCVCVHAVASTS